MTAFEKVSGMFSQRSLGETVATEVLTDYRQEIAEWVMTSKNIEKIITDGVQSALDAAGQECGEREAKAILLAIIPDLADAIRSYGSTSSAGG